jgi:hypothetical protein
MSDGVESPPANDWRHEIEALSSPSTPHAAAPWQHELANLSSGSDTEVVSPTIAPLWRTELDMLSSGAESPAASPINVDDPVFPPEQPLAFSLVFQRDYAATDSLQPQLLTAFQNAFILAARSPGEDICDESHRVVEYLVGRKIVDGSTTMEAIMADTNRKNFSLLRHATAAASLMYERMTWSNIEKTIANGPPETHPLAPTFQRCLYLEFSSYDGVDLHLRTTGALRAGPMMITRPDPQPPAASEILPGSSELHAAPPSHVLMQTVKGKASKILHCDGFVSMLVKFGQELCIVKGEHLTWLQCSDRSTAECLAAMIRKQRISTEHCERFERKVRLVAVDGAGYNARAERALLRERVGWNLLVFQCLAHVLAGVFTKTWALSKIEISCCIAFAMSVTHGNEQQVWTSILMQAIRRTLKLIDEPVSAAAMEFKRNVIHTFLGCEPNELAVRCANPFFSPKSAINVVPHMRRPIWAHIGAIGARKYMHQGPNVGPRLYCFIWVLGLETLIRRLSNNSATCAIFGDRHWSNSGSYWILFKKTDGSRQRVRVGACCLC